MRKKYGAIVDRIEESVLYTELNTECEEILDGCDMGFRHTTNK